MSLIVKIILVGSLLLTLSTPAANKAKLFHLCFISILQLINSISRDLQKLLKYLMAQQLLHFIEFHLLHQLQCFLIIQSYA